MILSFCFYYVISVRLRERAHSRRIQVEKLPGGGKFISVNLERFIFLIPSPQPSLGESVVKGDARRGFSRSHAARGNLVAPRRTEHQAGVHHWVYTGEPAGGPALSGAAHKASALTVAGSWSLGG